MLVEQIIQERYVNAVGFDPEAQEVKRRYLDQVWDILQKSYAPIGGIKGKGFETKESMLDLPMWKMGIRDGRIRAVIMYKDKNGRKSVAVGTDGSEEGNWFVNDIFKNELSRSYGEKSKAALGKMMKTYPFDVLEPFLVSPDRVAEMNPQDRVIPIKQVPKEDWPADAVMTLNKYPQLIDYGYLRDIAPGTTLFKVMLGTPGKKIR
jgi:hypothetical protein